MITFTFHVRQVNSSFENATHFNRPAIRIQKRLVFIFRPFVRKAYSDKTQKLLPQVSFATRFKDKVRGNQYAVIFQDAPDFCKRLFRIGDNVKRICNPYIRAQKYLGAAKTSAFYAIAPFIGVLFSIVLLNEEITTQYIVALLIMIVGTAFVIYDTLIREHSHLHKHIFTHTHNGIPHTHTIEHSHLHSHFFSNAKHCHHHNVKDLENLATNSHA